MIVFSSSQIKKKEIFIAELIHFTCESLILSDIKISW